MTGAKFRTCMIELYIGLKGRNTDSEILLLVESAMRISEILYMPEAERNPRNILHLYNLTWLHHELCNKLIIKFHGGMKHTKFLVHTYMHWLHMHLDNLKLCLDQCTLRTKSVFLTKHADQQLLPATDTLKMSCTQQLLGYRQRQYLKTKSTDAQLIADSFVA